jgi:hypothetical protein
VSRHKGALRPNQIDRGWPHQIALLSDLCTGENYETVRAFNQGLSVAPLGHTFFHNDQWHQVFCFSERADAAKFQARFGGDWFDPSRRGRGKRWHLLKPEKTKYY